MELAKTETCEVTIGRRLRRWYYGIFKRYRRLETRFASYSEADGLIRQNGGKPEREQWVLALPEEDNNRVIGRVFIARQERILE